MQLQSLFNYFKSHPESSWLMEPQNCQKLYEFVMKHPIKNVLDLGTGIGLSASVVALALKDKGEKDFRIDSLVGKNVLIYDGIVWRWIDNFRILAKNKKFLKLQLMANNH